jgi:hypothetical protein
MSKLASGEWDEIARQYRAGTPVNVVARRFKVSRATIERKAIQFGWGRDQGDDADSVAPRLDHKASGVSQEFRQVGGAHGSDPRAFLIEQQRAAWEELCAFREDAYRILRGQKPKLLKGIDVVDVADRLSLAAAVIRMVEKEARSLMIAQEGERRAYGYDYKQQQASQAEDEATARQRAELIRSILNTIDGLKQRAERADAIEKRYGDELRDSGMI